MPEILSGEEPLEPAEKKTTKGEEMIERRLWEREQRDEQRPEAVRNVLGSEALELWRKLEVLEPPTEEYGATASIIENTEQRFASKMAQLHLDLGKLAAERPEELEKFFESYFLKLKDAEALTRLLAETTGLDYAHDEEFTSEVEERIAEAATKEPSRPGEEIREEERRKYIAHEAAAVLVDRYSFEAGEDQPYPQELILPMVAYRMEMMERRATELKKEFSRQMIEFKGRIARFIEANGLPLDPAVVAERLDAVQCEVVDGWTAHLAETLGGYDSLTHRMRLSADLPQQEIPGVFTHEAIHAVSGQTDLVTPDEWEGFLKTEQTRVGLHFEPSFEQAVGPVPVPPERPRLTWLNEAVTEKLTLELLEQKQGGSYESERELLGLLIEKGIPQDVIWRAYFENYEEKKTGEHREPALRELFRKTNAVFGERFLVALDEFIRRSAPNKLEQGLGLDSGITRAVFRWLELGDSFPKHIRSYEWRPKKPARHRKKKTQPPQK